MSDLVARKTKMPNMWEDRAELSSRQWRSQAAFETLGDRRRTAVLLAVGDRLVELLGSLHEWVPRSINLNGDQVLKVAFQVALSSMKDEDVDQRVGIEVDRANAVAELAEFARQMKAPQ